MRARAGVSDNDFLSKVVAGRQVGDGIPGNAYHPGKLSAVCAVGACLAEHFHSMRSVRFEALGAEEDGSRAGGEGNVDCLAVLACHGQGVAHRDGDGLRVVRGSVLAFLHRDHGGGTVGRPVGVASAEEPWT